jgi:uncharacterized protein YdbL (DUF1318 family)
MRNPTHQQRTRRLILVSLLIAAFGVGGGQAAADPLDDAKAQGLVGEQFDGYLGVVASDAPASVKQLVERINAGRLEKYRGIADKRGATVKAVAALAGAKLIERAAPGSYVKNPGGKWVRK